MTTPTSRKNDEGLARGQDMFADYYHDHDLDLEGNYSWIYKFKYDSDS